MQTTRKWISSGVIAALVLLPLWLACKDASPAGGGAPESGTPTPAEARPATPAPAAPDPAAPVAPPVGPSAASRALGERFPEGTNCGVEAVQAAMQPHTDAIRGCYQAGLMRNPDLAGALRFRIVVDELGKAQNVTVAEDTLGAPAVAKCVQTVVESAAYAPSPEHRPCNVLYPFDFDVSPQVREQLKGGTP